MARTKKSGSLVKRNNTYYLQFDVDKQRYKRVIRNPDTGKSATTEAQANKWRDYAEQLIREQANGQNAEAVALPDLESAYRKFLPNYSKRKGRMHVDSSKESRISPRTMRTNINYLNSFVAFLNEQYPRVKTSRHISSVHAEAFMATKAKYKDSTYNRCLMSMRHVCEVIPHLDRGAFEAITPRSTQDVRDDTDSKERFTDEQLLKMQGAAQGWLRPAMFIGYYTGLRLGDVLCLRWNNLDGDFVKLTVRKTGKEMTIYAPEIMPHLEAWRERTILEWNDAFTNKCVARLLGVHEITAAKLINQNSGLPDANSPEVYAKWLHETCRKALESGSTAPGIARYAEIIHTLPLEPVPAELTKYVFPRQAQLYLGIGKTDKGTARKPNQTAASKRFQRFLKSCGIETVNNHGQAVCGFHSLRVTYATMHRIEGGDIASTQEMLQHSDSRTTEGYDRRTENEIRNELIARYVPVSFPGQKSAASANPAVDPLKQQAHRLIDAMDNENVQELMTHLQQKKISA